MHLSFLMGSTKVFVVIPWMLNVDSSNRANSLRCSKNHNITISLLTNVFDSMTSSTSAETYDADAQNEISPTKIGKAPTKKNVAQLLGVSAVTPPLIAYIACIVSL